MQYTKSTIRLLFLAIIVFFCGFKSSNSKMLTQKKVTALHCLKSINDTLQYLYQGQIDYGFNKDIDLSGDRTFKIYKKYVKTMPAAGPYVCIKSKNAYIWISFNYNQEIEKIDYSSLVSINPEVKMLYKKNSYESNHLSIKIGDSLPYCLEKLAGVNYKIEHYSSKSIGVHIDCLVKFIGIEKDFYDEYHCTYGFTNNKLDFISIDYYRNAK